MDSLHKTILLRAAPLLSGKVMAAREAILRVAKTEKIDAHQRDASHQNKSGLLLRTC
jgi:hypothetical protein